LDGTIFTEARRKVLEFIVRSKTWQQVAELVQNASDTEENEVSLLALNYLTQRIGEVDHVRKDSLVKRGKDESMLYQETTNIFGEFIYVFG
jgi:hypothetical protein